MAGRIIIFLLSIHDGQPCDSPLPYQATTGPAARLRRALRLRRAQSSRRTLRPRALRWSNRSRTGAGALWARVGLVVTIFKWFVYQKLPESFRITTHCVTDASTLPGFLTTGGFVDGLLRQVSCHARQTYRAPAPASIAGCSVDA